MYLTLHRDNKEFHFIYTPYHELVSSLHTLSNPNHHKSRLVWAEEKLTEMSGDLLDQLERISEITDNFMSVYGLEKPKDHWELSILDMMDVIEAMDNSMFMFQVVGESGSKFHVAEFDGPSFQEAFVTFLRNFYMEHFLNDIAFSEPIMIRHIRKEYMTAEKMDIYQYIQSLHPRIEITEDRILFHKYKLYDVKKSEIEQANIHADSYVIPHLLMGIEEGEVHFVSPVYLTSHNQNFMPTELLGVFKGLGDGTRLNIVRHLYKQPLTTQKLSDLLDISEPGISKQLKRLHQVGIVYKERDGSYIRYHLNQQVIDSLVLYMYEFLQ